MISFCSRSSPPIYMRAWSTFVSEIFVRLSLFTALVIFFSVATSSFVSRKDFGSISGTGRALWLSIYRRREVYYPCSAWSATGHIDSPVDFFSCRLSHVLELTLTLLLPIRGVFDDHDINHTNIKAPVSQGFCLYEPAFRQAHCLCPTDNDVVEQSGVDELERTL